jgi:hypothetical protein
LLTRIFFDIFYTKTINPRHRAGYVTSIYIYIDTHTTYLVCCILIPCSLSDATIKKRVSGWLAEKVNVKDRLRGDIETLKSNKKAEYKVISLVLKSIPSFPCIFVTYCNLILGFFTNKNK